MISKGWEGMNKRWWQGEIGRDLPITIVSSIAWCLMIAGMFVFAFIETN